MRGFGFDFPGVGVNNTKRNLEEPKTQLGSALLELLSLTLVVINHLLLLERVHLFRHPLLQQFSIKHLKLVALFGREEVQL